MHSSPKKLHKAAKNHLAVGILITFFKNVVKMVEKDGFVIRGWVFNAMVKFKFFVIAQV